MQHTEFARVPPSPLRGGLQCPSISCQPWNGELCHDGDVYNVRGVGNTMVAASEKVAPIGAEGELTSSGQRSLPTTAGMHRLNDILTTRYTALQPRDA